MRKGAAEKRGVVVWNSNTYRLESINAESGKLHLELGYIEYKVRATMRNIPGIYDLTDEHWPKGVFVTSIIRTGDGFYVFGELSGKTIVDKIYDTIGGTLTPEEGSVKTGNDLFTALYRELKEECKISGDSIKSCSLRGAILTDFLNVGLLFEVELTRTKDEVKKDFEMENDGELSDLIFVAPGEAKKFTESIAHFGPAAGAIMDFKPWIILAVNANIVKQFLRDVVYR